MPVRVYCGSRRNSQRRIERQKIVTIATITVTIITAAAATVEMHPEAADYQKQQAADPGQQEIHQA